MVLYNDSLVREREREFIRLFTENKDFLKEHFGEKYEYIESIANDVASQSGCGGGSTIEDLKLSVKNLIDATEKVFLLLSGSENDRVN